MQDETAAPSDPPEGISAAEEAEETGAAGADGTDEEKAIKESVDNVYKALANGKITPSRCEGGAGYEFCKSFSEKKLSNCFTLNGWFVDATTTAK